MQALINKHLTKMAGLICFAIFFVEHATPLLLG